MSPHRTTGPPPPTRPSVGISSCLLGRRVRFDGGHKRNDVLIDELSGVFDWVPICPEVEMGLPTPREPLVLSGSLVEPRMVAPGSGRDVTEMMLAFARARLAQLERIDLCGYVFKKGSPSCGVFDVPVFDELGVAYAMGRGLFARAITSARPSLPVEEEGRLADAQIRESFIERVFAFRDR